MTIKISYLVDYPRYTELLGRWFTNHWGRFHPERDFKSWESELHFNKDKFPMTLIALDESGAEPKLVGTAALRVGIHSDLGLSNFESRVWLERVYVDPAERGKRIASLLIEESIRIAEMAQFDEKPIRELALLSRDAGGLYKKYGWAEIARPEYKGGPVSLMIREIKPAPECLLPTAKSSVPWFNKVVLPKEKTAETSLYAEFTDIERH